MIAGSGSGEIKAIRGANYLKDILPIAEQINFADGIVKLRSSRGDAYVRRITESLAIRRSSQRHNRKMWIQ
jgi:hypothetical protein